MAKREVLNIETNPSDEVLYTIDYETDRYPNGYCVDIVWRSQGDHSKGIEAYGYQMDGSGDYEPLERMWIDKKPPTIEKIIKDLDSHLDWIGEA